MIEPRRPTPGEVPADHMHRALLIEFVNADQFPGRVSYFYPFLRGFFDEEGVPTRWIRLGISTTNLLEHQRDQVTLTDGELARLIEVVREHRPTLIMTTDPLFGPQAEQLQAHGSDVRVRDLSRSTPQIEGMRPFAGPLELDRPDFMPRYDWEPGNEAATRKKIDNVYLAQTRSCGHQKRVADNPCYKRIDDGRVNDRLGCAFCTNWIGKSRVSGRTPNDWIIKQLKGIASSRGTPDRFPHGVLLESLESPEILRQCIRTMQATGLADHVQLLLAIRTDNVSAFEHVLLDHIQRHPDSGLRFGVYGSGIESFSQDDLLLFNKGTTPLDSIRAINTFRELEYRYPGRFWYTGTTFILFTPWTTPETVHLNLGLIRFFRLKGREAGNVFQSRLRLHPDLAITSLAERDGLVVEDESDPLVVVGRRKLFGREQPWRFADVRLRPLSRIALRLDLLGGDPRDSLTRKIMQTLIASFPDFKEEDLVDYLLCMVDVVRTETAVLDEESLLDRAMNLWNDRRDKKAASPERRRFRIGDRRHDLLGLLTRLTPVVIGGLRPVLSVNGVMASEMEPDGSAFLRQEGLHWALIDDSSTLLIAGDEDMLERRSALQNAIQSPDNPEQHFAAVLETARLHGVPECCARAFAEGPFSEVRLPIWAAFSKRNEKVGHIPAALNPMLVPGFSFVPCTPDCPEAARTYRTWFGALDEDLLPDENNPMAYVFSFDDPYDSALTPLHVIDCDGQSLRYGMPEEASEDDELLRERLAAGNLLRFIPGQIQICRDECLVDVMTASHGIWYAGRCWDPEEWRELARTALHVARTQAGEEGLSRSRQAASRDEEHSRRGKLLFLLEKAIERYPDRFGDVSIVRLKVSQSGSVIRVRVAIAGNEYELALKNHSNGDVCSFRTGHFSVTYGEETRPELPGDQKRIVALVRIFDRAVAHYAPDCLP